MFKTFNAAGLAAAALALSLAIGSNSAQADRLFAISGAGGAASTLYEIDPASGAILTTIGATGFAHIASIAFHPVTGQLYGIANVSDTLLTIDIATGLGTAVATLGGDWSGNNAPDMTFTPDGTAWTWSESSPDNLNSIDLASGATTEIGSSGLSTFQFGLAANSSGTIYAKDGDGAIYTVDQVTGAATFVIDIDPTGNQFDNALAFDSSDSLFTIDRTGRSSSTGDLYTIDLGAGTTTLVGSTGIAALSAIAFQPVAAAVPAPGSLLLLGAGLLGLMARQRRAAPA